MKCKIKYFDIGVFGCAFYFTYLNNSGSQEICVIFIIKFIYFIYSYLFMCCDFQNDKYIEKR